VRETFSEEGKKKWQAMGGVGWQVCERMGDRDLGMDPTDIHDHDRCDTTTYIYIAVGDSSGGFRSRFADAVKGTVSCRLMEQRVFLLTEFIDIERSQEHGC
jgi:hypothetical protein